MLRQSMQKAASESWGCKADRTCSLSFVSAERLLCSCRRAMRAIVKTCKRLCAPQPLSVSCCAYATCIPGTAPVHDMAGNACLIPERHGDLAVLRQGAPRRWLVHLQHQHVEHPQAQQVVPRRPGAALCQDSLVG